MNIEQEIFKKRKIIYDKLIPYGFCKLENQYVLKQNIDKDSFRVEIIVTEEGIVKGKIYDLSFDEEYTNFRMENQIGEFVGRIREQFINLLQDIRKNCTIESYFVTDQANRIASLILNRFGDIPDFAWESSPGNGIFRNPQNGKWYGLIMNINKKKIDDEDKEVEVLNVKLEEEEIKNLIDKKGFYKAYHMNKKNWITILLDDTLKDEKIMGYIEKSHQFTEQRKEWIIPANPKYYDVVHCFDNVDTVLWKQSTAINVGDFVYLYVASPYSCLLYKCEAVEVNIPYTYKDQNIIIAKAMKIKLVTKFQENKYSFEKLKEYGIKSIRGPRFLPQKLSKEINNSENS